jgi:isocitrate dehydrogenase
LADALSKNAEGVLKEMIDVQGSKVDIGGYYKVDEQKAAKAMRPSATLNKLIDL